MGLKHLSLPASEGYVELREQEVRNARLFLLDGKLITNQQEHLKGTSARCYHNGGWGVASSSEVGSSVSSKLHDKAYLNAQAMSVFGRSSHISLPQDSYRGEHLFQGNTPFTRQETIDWMRKTDAIAKNKYPKLTSTTLGLFEEDHLKSVKNSFGTECVSNLSRSMYHINLTIQDKNGKPVEMRQPLCCKGSASNLNLTEQYLESVIDELYEHLMQKTEPVNAVGGNKQVIIAPQLAGMLAHEAIGHPCEADIVQSGAITGGMLNQHVASELITMVDFAHSYQGEELLVPIYADEEGTPAQDVTLIENGVLRGFMHNRESAAEMETHVTGNARAAQPLDEPIIRMRNTAILPGRDNYNEMIKGVEDGYLLLKTGSGQADTNGEFMFSVHLGYEIKNGVIGKAIKDTTVSGNAFDTLKSVDAVSSDMFWTNAGYCGKKQWLLVSMGGPALRTFAHIGGK